MKSVLVVGAGPAGLVAAKTLLQYGGGKHYKVTVFEAAERVGGMWRALETEKGDKCSPDMRTNLSRFTVAFSDLSWNAALAYADDKENLSAPRAPSMFPKAWQVGRYLEAYAQKFIPEENIVCNREVTMADYTETENQRWNVSSVNTISQKSYTDKFDHLIVASGFFGRPNNALSDVVQLDATVEAKTVHSTEFRHLSSFDTNSGNVVVIGGGISGSEAAATAAFQISNAKYAPGPKPAWANSKVVHIVNRPFYCLPRYLPQEAYNPAKQAFHLAPNFVPLDLILYNISRKGEGPISASNGLVPPEKAKKGHEFIRSLVSDQRDLGSPTLVYRQEHVQYPPYTGVSDTYSEFVRSGLIVLKQGYASTATQQPQSNEGSHTSGMLEVEVKPNAPWSTVPSDVS